MRQDARALAGAFQGTHDVEQVGVVALLGRRCSEMPEPVKGIIQRVDAGAPTLVAEWRIGDHVVEGLEGVAVLVFRIGERVARLDDCGGVVVQIHVHAGKAAGCRVLLLPVECHLGFGFVGDLQQKRAGTAGRVIYGGVAGGLGLTDTDDLRHDAADFGGRIELPLALAAFGREVAHQVFVGIAQNVIAIGPVLREVERRVLECGDEIGEAVHLLLATAELAVIIEVGEIGLRQLLVLVDQRGDDLLVDQIADVSLPLQRDHILEARARRNGDWGILLARVFVADVFDEEQDEDVVLVLAGIHAATEFVAARPEGRVEFGFLDRHLEVFEPVTHAEDRADPAPIEP